MADFTFTTTPGETIALRDAHDVLLPGKASDPPEVKIERVAKYAKKLLFEDLARREQRLALQAVVATIREKYPVQPGFEDMDAPDEPVVVPD